MSTRHPASTRSRWDSRLGVACIDALGRLPLRVLYVLSDLLCPVVHRVVRYRLGVVRRNLEGAFPELSPAERRAIEGRFYRWFCDLAVEIVRFRHMPESELRRRLTVVGMPQVEAGYGDADFALCYLGHYGNWEWLCSIPLWQTLGGMCQVYHPMRNAAFDAWFLDGRARFGAVNIPMKHTLKRLVELRQGMQDGTDVRRGYMFGCIADQLPKRQNIHYRMEFLHQDTGVFTGVEKMGRRMRMRWYYTRITRPERGRYEVCFEPMDDVDPEASEFAYTTAYMRRLEADIRACPELWLWTHNRWKR